MPWAYLLRCADDSYYAGSTRQLDERIVQHASGAGAVYTSTRLPVALVWSAEFDDIGTAFAWEKRIQGWSRAKREALIAGAFDRLPGLSVRGGPRQAEV